GAVPFGEARLVHGRQGSCGRRAALGPVPWSDVAREHGVGLAHPALEVLVRCALVQESDLDVGALAYPAGARLAPGDELLEGMVDGDGREQLGQDDGVLHGEAAALR